MENKKTEYNKVNKNKNIIEEPIVKLNEKTKENNLAAEEPKKPKKVTGKVSANGSSLNLRESPSTTANILTVIPPKSDVTITDESNPDFYKIVWHGFEGFVMKKFIVK